MYIEALVSLLLFFLFQCYKRWKFGAAVVDWPVIGMLPSLFLNLRCVHNFITGLLAESGGTFLLKGPWFSKMDMLLTSDPANVHYILTKNFHNFGKGSDFKTIFDVWGDGIFVAESESWENQRRAAKLFIGNSTFHQFAARTTWEKVKSSMFPILETASKTGEVLDLQNIFERLAFDFTCISILGHDPNSLSEEGPNLAVEKAFSYTPEALFHRHVVPLFFWKLQRFLRIGSEKKMVTGKKIIDGFISDCISLQENGMINDGHDMLSCYLRINHGKCEEEVNVPPQVWRDALLNFIFAGKDTISAALTWFFWVLATHPKEEDKIRLEMAEVFPDGVWTFAGVEEIRKLVYLHAALCETLRLFPPVALQHKSPLNDDVLPSGHLVKRNARVVISFYSMGRMESIWGKDSGVFRPERWISEEGTIKLMPSYKFPAFNAGPRTCIGRETSFIQMKIIIAAVLSRFTTTVVDGNRMRPRASIVLHVENGLNVKVTKL